MRVARVKTFVAVASARSITLAARQPAYSESTVASHVRELEKLWRIHLFVPGARNWVCPYFS